MKDRKTYTGRIGKDADPVYEAEMPEVSVEEKKNRTGHITGCELLNVRRDPTTSSPVIATLTSSDFVMIREKDDATDFFKVTTTKGVSGYCMKKYIEFND